MKRPSVFSVVFFGSNIPLSTITVVWLDTFSSLSYSFFPSVSRVELSCPDSQPTDLQSHCTVPKNTPKNETARPRSQFLYSCIRAVSFLGIHKLDLVCSAERGGRTHIRRHQKHCGPLTIYVLSLRYSLPQLLVAQKEARRFMCRKPPPGFARYFARKGSIVFLKTEFCKKYTKWICEQNTIVSWTECVIYAFLIG